MKRIIFIILILINLIVPFLAKANGTGGVLPNPMKCDNLFCLFMDVIRLFLGAVGLLALFVFMWGGFLMLTSAGNPDKIKQAKDTLLWASIGIIVILSSWVIVKYLMEVTIGAT